MDINKHRARHSNETKKHALTDVSRGGHTTAGMEAIRHTPMLSHAQTDGSTAYCKSFKGLISCHPGAAIHDHGALQPKETTNRVLQNHPVRAAPLSCLQGMALLTAASAPVGAHPQSTYVVNAECVAPCLCNTAVHNNGPIHQGP